MTQAVKDSFLDLERHRQLLDANISKLRKSLQHWQIWEAEYEGLKEEIHAAGPAATHDQLAAIGRDYEGKLVTPREVEEILGVKTRRSAAQATNVLSRRIDYVAQNVKTLEKQVEVAENKLAAATIISTPDVRNEEGLPITEIIEDLDDEDNVISGRTEKQGSARGQLVEVLEKAGFKDLPPAGTNEGPFQDQDAENSSPEMFEDDQHSISFKSEPSRKSVMFAEGTKHGPEIRQIRTAGRNNVIYSAAKQQNSAMKESLVIPSNESPEDAALRREMLQYGMEEVGAVVAELDLEDCSDFTDDGFDDEDTSSVDDEEDEFGRSTKQLVSDEMHQRMIELETRLGVRMMHNTGPNSKVSLKIVGEDNGLEKENIPDDSKVKDNTIQATVKRRAVHFAEDLDIFPVPDEMRSDGLKPDQEMVSRSPLGDVIERTSPGLGPMTKSIPSQKASRLNRGRAVPSDPEHLNSLPGASLPSRARLPPPGPEGKALADRIIEREVPDHPPSEPNELDAALIQQEVTTEYYRKRNRMIQKQGGFMKDMGEETSSTPFTEEEGGPKRVSRFKAARLART